MRFVSIPALCMAVMTFYVGFYHLFLYYRRRYQHPEDFSFAVACFTMGFYDVMSAGAYNASSVLDGFGWQRGQVASLSLIGAAYTWFFTDYVPSKTKTIRNVLLVFFCISAFCVAFFTTPFFWHPDLPAVKHAHMPFHLSITYFEVTPGVFTQFLGAMGFVVFLYAYILCFRLYKENKAKSIPLLITNTIFCIGLVNDALYHDLVIKSIYIIEYAYMANVLLMAYSLSNTVVESAVLKEAFEASEKKYRSLVDHSLVGIFILTDEIIKYCNHEFAQIFGYSQSKDVIGMPCHRLIFPLENSDAAQKSTLCSEDDLLKNDTFERKGVTASGVPIDLEIRASRIRYESQQAIQGSVIDITGRKKADQIIRQERDKAQKYLDIAGALILVLDVNGKVQLINKKGCEILQHEEREIVGRDWFEQYIPKPYRENLKKGFIGMLKSQERMLEYHENPVLRRDGDYRTIAWYNKVLKDDSDRIVGIISSGEDITERKAAEEQAKRSLKEKEVLLKEIHHRVKNNLQIIISLLNLESAKIGDEQVLRIFEECNQRIRTMSMIHERLYQSEHFESIDFRGYAEALLEELFMSFHVGDRIKSELNIQRFYLGLDTAIPCGLILNELVTNSIKHAFPNDGGGRIRVEFRLRDGDHYELVVSDNGVGMPEGINIHEIDTLGLKLIDVLSQQLNGKFEISGKKGTCCTVSFMR